MAKKTQAPHGSITTNDPLPRMPEEPITRERDGLTFRLDSDPERFSSGGLRLSFADTSVDVSQGEEKVGSVCGVLGGGVVVRVGARNWHLSAEELWRVASEMDAAYMAERKAT